MTPSELLALSKNLARDKYRTFIEQKETEAEKAKQTLIKRKELFFKILPYIKIFHGLITTAGLPIQFIENLPSLTLTLQENSREICNFFILDISIIRFYNKKNSNNFTDYTENNLELMLNDLAKLISDYLKII